MSEHEESDSYELVMPFVVCKNSDGPYDTESFVAGIYLGEITALILLGSLGVTIARYVPTPLVPQIDLLVMKHECHMRAVAWDEHPDDWTLVEIQRSPFPPDNQEAET